MTPWVIVFFTLAVIAGLLGFVVPSPAALVGKVEFFIFAALFIIALLFGVTGGKRS